MNVKSAKKVFVKDAEILIGKVMRSDGFALQYVRNAINRINLR